MAIRYYVVCVRVIMLLCAILVVIALALRSRHHQL